MNIALSPINTRLSLKYLGMPGFKILLMLRSEEQIIHLDHINPAGGGKIVIKLRNCIKFLWNPYYIAKILLFTKLFCEDKCQYNVICNFICLNLSRTLLMNDKNLNRVHRDNFRTLQIVSTKDWYASPPPPNSHVEILTSTVIVLKTGSGRGN